MCWTAGWRRMMIKVNGLKKYYERGSSIVRALDGINLELNEKFVAITGGAGSGKSTLLRIIGGMEQQTEGTVIVNDTDLSIFGKEELAIYRRRHVGFVFREDNLLPGMNIYENIILPIQLDGSPVNREYIEQLAMMMGMRDKLLEMPGNVSGGEQQKAAIIRALATKAELIVADEPTGNLDYRSGMEIIGLLKMTSRELHQMILYVTQTQEIAEQATRIVELKEGRVSAIKIKGIDYAV